MSNSVDRPTPGDESAEKMLREGLRAPALSPEALQRIRLATEAEWRVQTQAPPRRRAWSIAAAASVAAITVLSAVGVYVNEGRPASGALLGTVARFDSPGIQQSRRLRPDWPLEPGSEVRVPQELDARGDSLIELAGGGNLRVARSTSFEIVAADAVRLARGEIYVDIPPGARGSAQFRVITDNGEFRHVGTQFAVAVVNRQTRLRVREGQVLWRAADGESTVGAGAEVTIDAKGARQRMIATSGREWSWAESLAPDIEIEDRPLREFLEWFSRETGRRLVLADEAALQQVERIHMRGSVRGLSAMEALSAVMASTTLHYELPEGAIRVSSARDPRPAH